MLLLALVCAYKVVKDPYVVWRSLLIKKSQELSRRLIEAERNLTGLQALRTDNANVFRRDEIALVDNFTRKIVEMNERREDVLAGLKTVDTNDSLFINRTRQEIANKMDQRSLLRLEVAALQEQLVLKTREIKRKQKSLEYAVSNNDEKRKSMQADQGKDLKEIQDRTTRMVALRKRLERWLKRNERERQCAAVLRRDQQKGL